MSQGKIKLAVVGSRGFCDYNLMKAVLSDYGISMIISGGARGADALAELYAKDMGIEFKVIPAEWDKYGKSAGFIRNQEIIKECDECVAFWDGQSRGTAHDIELCKKYNKPCNVVTYDSN
jgi:hypothetical protein